MTRPAGIALATAVGLLTVGCSAPDAPAALATPVPARPTPAPMTVLVQVADGAPPLAEAWADELRTAVMAGHGDLSLAESPEDAGVVVRIDDVETDVQVASGEEESGPISVMRGAIVVDGSARVFDLRYPGEARPQAEALARNLRGFAAEGGPSEEQGADGESPGEPDPAPES